MANTFPAFTLDTIAVRQFDGLFCLNDLHAAAGGEKRHEPNRFIRNQQTQALLAELGASPEMGTPLRTVNDGANNGTYACRELVIAYAAWINAAFHLKVIRVFLAQHAPAATITPAQCQHLAELVDLVVESGRQKTHGETWARFHRKMKVNKYSLLHPSKFDAACEYLKGKLDDTSIAALVHKHLPDALLAAPAVPTLPAPQAIDVNTLCQLVLGGIFTGQDFGRLAWAVNLHQCLQAAGNPHRGYGEEVAGKLRDLSWSDLHIITQRATMEVLMRTAPPAQALAA